MKTKLFFFTFTILVSIGLHGQTVTPNLGLTIPSQGQANWGTIIGTDLSLIDTFAGTVPQFPATAGMVFNTSNVQSRNALSSDIVALWSSCTSGFLAYNGTCGSSGSGLSSFTVGNLSPIFTASIGSSPTTAPALTFTLSSAAQNSVLAGPPSGGAGAPSYQTAPTFSATNLTNFPTLPYVSTSATSLPSSITSAPGLPFQSLTTVGTSGAATLTSGVLNIPNYAGGGSGITSIGLAVPAWLSVIGSPLTANGTLTIFGTTGQTANQFIATPNGTTGAVGLRSIVAADIATALAAPGPIGGGTPSSGGFTFVTAQSVTSPIFAPTATHTTVNCSTSGTAVFSQPLQGSSDRKVLIHMAACVGAASYTYPAVFTNSPSIYASNNVAASIVTSVSATAVTVTGATTTGSVSLEDF